MKSFIKKIVPKRLLSLYHYLFAILANIVFGRPSRKLIVIGITGTKGKTSVANFVWSVLQSSGIKTGIITTANIRIGEREEENAMHMTMPGRFFVQKTLARMVKEKCEVAIVETTSQGIAQSRHVGIQYDVCVFTNLTPEHIESHGSFENYKKTKGEMFKVLSKYPKKIWRNKNFPKTIIANVDDENSSFYLGFESDLKQKFSIKNTSDAQAKDINVLDNSVDFLVDGFEYKLSVPGDFNVYNALPAILAGRLFGLTNDQINKGLSQLNTISGRMEEVLSGRDFRVFVDYAHEPAGLQSIIKAGKNLVKNGKTIVLIGAPGGGRDKSKRPLMGEVAGKFADVVVVSDDEPYEENPEDILSAIKTGALNSGKIEGENLFVIGDRREAIKKALSLAKSGDVVIFTGLGHQKVRMVGTKAIPWVEKEIVKEELMISNA